MKTKLALSLLCVLWLPLPAMSSQPLAEKHGCMGCHLMDKMTVGPAIRQIAQRYANEPGAATRLYDKVKLGGGGPWRGVWTAVPMPPHEGMADDESMKRIVDWMLQQK